MQLLGRIPLVPSINTRGVVDASDFFSVDQQLSGAVVVVAKNPFTQTMTAYVDKIPAFAEVADTSATAGCSACHDSPAFVLTAAFGGTNSTIYSNALGSAGTITGTCIYFTEAEIGSTTVLLVPSTDGTAWFLAEDAQTQTSYTGDTHTNAIIDNIASTAGMYVGQALSGTGLQAGTRISGVTSGTAITVTPNTTATAAGVTLTKTPIAKIIDADFPTDVVGAMYQMDGYVFVMTTDRKIYQSNLNSITAWTAGEFITADQSTGVGVTVQKYKNNIVGMTSLDIEFFINAGNSSGSVLSRQKNLTINIGVTLAAAAGDAKVTSSAQDNLFFCSAPQGSSAGIYMLDGFVLKKISTPFIDAIASSGGAGNYRIWQITMGGQSFLYAYLSTTIQFLYSLEHGFWTASGWSNAYVFNEFQATYSVRVLGGYDLTDGKLWTISHTSTYSGAPTVDIRISDGGFGDQRRTVVKMVELIADNQASGTSTIAYSDDDGSSYTTMGTVSMTTRQKRLWVGGAYDGHRMWKITHSASTPWRGRFLDVWGYKCAV